MVFFLPRFMLLEIAFKGVELLLPVSSVLLYPLRCIAYWICIESTPADPAISGSTHQASSFQHPQMLGDGRAGYVERASQLTHSGIPVCKPPQNGPPDRVGQSAKRAVEFRTIGNHLVTNNASNASYRQARTLASPDWSA
jgi:hypothetical protein